MTYEEYKAIDAIHYSALSALSKHPLQLQKMLNRQELPTEDLDPSMTLGSVTDCLLFTPQDFDTRFIVSSIVKPTDKLGLVTDRYLQLKGSIVEIERDKLLQATTEIGYQSNWKPDTIYANLSIALKPYFDSLATIGNRIAITPAVKQTADNLLTKLLTNDFTGKIFDKTNPHEEHFPQFFFQWVGTLENHLSYTAKMLADYVVIDHKEKTIQPYDLKVVSSDPSQFFKTHFLKYNYYIQAALYKIGLIIFKQQTERYRDYRVLSFKFIVINDWYGPIIWEVPIPWFEASIKGFTVGTDTYRGVEELMNDYLWHTLNQQFEYPRAVYEKGLLQIPTNLLL